MLEFDLHTSRLKLMRKGDITQLLPPDVLEKSPAVIRLKSQFQAALPNHFSRANLFVSPLQSAEHVLRANCTNEGCGIRATTHVKRDPETSWDFTDKTLDGTIQVNYSRENNNPCEECQTLLAQK